MSIDREKIIYCVFSFVHANPGIKRDDLRDLVSEKLGISKKLATSRIKELVGSGLIDSSGFRIKTLGDCDDRSICNSD